MSFTDYTNERRNSGSIMAQSNGYHANNDITEQSNLPSSPSQSPSCNTKQHFMGNFNGYHTCGGDCHLGDSDDEDAKGCGDCLGDGDEGRTTPDRGEESPRVREGHARRGGGGGYVQFSEGKGGGSGSAGANDGD